MIHDCEAHWETLLENCAIPASESSYKIVNKIRSLAHQYGSVKTFRAYLECPEQISPKLSAIRSELQSCGVSLIDCPHNGRKDVADKMLMSNCSGVLHAQLSIDFDS